MTRNVNGLLLGAVGYCLYRTGMTYFYNEGMGIVGIGGGFVSDVWFVYTTNLCACLTAVLVLAATYLGRAISLSTMQWTAVGSIAAGIVAGYACVAAGVPSEAMQIPVGALCGVALALLIFVWFDVFSSCPNVGSVLVQIALGYLLYSMLSAGFDLVAGDFRLPLAFACVAVSGVIAMHCAPDNCPKSRALSALPDRERSPLVSTSLCFFVFVGVVGLMHTSVLGSDYESVIASIPMWLTRVVTASVFVLIACVLRARLKSSAIFRVVFPALVIVLSLMPLLGDAYGTLAGGAVIVGYQVCGAVFFLYLVWESCRLNISSRELASFYILGSSAALLIGLTVGLLVQSVSSNFNLPLITLLAFVAAYPLILVSRLIPRKRRRWLLAIDTADEYTPATSAASSLLASSRTDSPGDTASDDEGGGLNPELSARSASVAKEYGLTEREQEIMEYLARGRSAKYIAEKLVISENTAWTHIKRIYAKTGVHGRQELMSLVEDEDSQ